jgi:NAD(P)-dependent dehydrogenase (short-subunit alcohol dehydrogenase family)
MGASRGSVCAKHARLNDVAVVKCDVADPGAVEEATERTVVLIGEINALVNCPRIADPRPLTALDAASWQRTITVNLSGRFFLSRATALRMRSAKSDGSIVNLESELATIGMPSYVAYCASKAAIVGLTKAMAAELAPAIRVNALCPGPVDTPMLRGEVALAEDPEAALAHEHERVPLRRFANAGEVADAAIWLLVDGRFATGSIVALDGGTTAV